MGKYFRAVNVDDEDLVPAKSGGVLGKFGTVLRGLGTVGKTAVAIAIAIAIAIASANIDSILLCKQNNESIKNIRNYLYLSQRAPIISN